MSTAPALTGHVRRLQRSWRKSWCLRVRACFHHGVAAAAAAAAVAPRNSIRKRIRHIGDVVEVVLLTLAGAAARPVSCGIRWERGEPFFLLFSADGLEKPKAVTDCCANAQEKESNQKRKQPITSAGGKGPQSRLVVVQKKKKKRRSRGKKKREATGGNVYAFPSAAPRVRVWRHRRERQHTRAQFARRRHVAFPRGICAQ